ncbi:MAG: UvrD-helicase domain-containing protein [Candidatus Omnitrophica bacterium]|nr:UvrD-helicase domain-containing protein [Candidatus Omnitrophota bacterium]
MNGLFQFPEVRVVEASAGSGKTYALAKRYVQLLLHTSSRTSFGLKHILAITFTNKAAGEMKTRIIDVLKGIALGRLPPVQAEDILTPLGLSASQARPLAAGLMQDVIRHYHFFQVQTIDSFMNTLLAGCAFKINLSARFKLKRNAVDYLQLSLDDLVDEAHGQKAVKVLFEAFIQQYLFLENRSGWFPKKDLLAVLVILFDQYNTYQRPLLTFDAGGTGVVELKKQFLKLAADLRMLLPAACDQRFVRALDGFIAAHPIGFDVDDVSRYFARPAPPVNAGGVISDELDRIWRTCGKLLRAICLQEAYALFNPYVHMFASVMEHFDRLQTKEDVLFLQQLNKKTGDLFDDGLVTTQELYYRLATRFHHYLVDEFQDTSLAQWHNLRMMVEEALATGGTLFYVGDKKQAIYSFRGGQSRLFDDLQRDLSRFNVTRETLNKNFRSHKHIVDFNNHIFSLDNLRAFILAVQQQDRLKDKDIVFGEEDWQRVEDVFGGARQIPRQDLAAGAVRVEIIAGRKKDDRLELARAKVVAIVKDARGRFPAGDIAVLTRNNAQVQMVTQWLVQEGIFAQSERTSDIKNHPLVRELAAFLRFVHSPIDNAAFAAFALGDLFPKASGLSAAEIQGFSFACRRRVSPPFEGGGDWKKGGGILTEVYFYKRFRAVYPQLWEQYFEEFFSQAGVYPLYELTVSICARLRCLELFPEAQGFVMHFLELIKRREEESCDLETFLEYFEALEDEERFVPMPAQDAVRVLTVHKAKGLEFSVVIVPFLEMSIKAGAGDQNGGQSFIWDMDEEGMRLLRLKESYTCFSDELKQRYAREYKEAFFAELNNVYVALTRPVWEMHILIPERAGNSVNPVPLLIPPELFSAGQLSRPDAPQLPVEARRFLPAMEYRQWIGHMQEEFLTGPASPAGGSASQAQARLEGERMHFCLSKLGNLNGMDVQGAIDRAIASAEMRFTSAGNWDLLRGRLQVLIDQEIWRPFFYLPAGTEVLCEQEVVNRFGDARRIDRLIVFPQEIWVVDFKTSRADEPRHQQQIEEYKKLAATLYPGRKVEGFLLYVEESK